MYIVCMQIRGTHFMLAARNKNKQQARASAVVHNAASIKIQGERALAPAAKMTMPAAAKVIYCHITIHTLHYVSRQHHGVTPQSWHF